MTDGQENNRDPRQIGKLLDCTLYPRRKFPFYRAQCAIGRDHRLGYTMRGGLVGDVVVDAGAGDAGLMRI